MKKIAAILGLAGLSLWSTPAKEITLLNAFENFYNLTNRPLGIESDNLCALIAR